jgi:hypothetical protein
MVRLAERNRYGAGRHRKLLNLGYTLQEIEPGSVLAICCFCATFLDDNC